MSHLDKVQRNSEEMWRKILQVCYQHSFSGKSDYMRNAGKWASELPSAHGMASQRVL